MTETIKLLGRNVEGVEQEGDPSAIHWLVKLGPYEIKITKWTFGYRESVERTINFSYHVKVGPEYLVKSESSVEDLETAMSIVNGALRKYISDKKEAEKIIEILVPGW